MLFPCRNYLNYVTEEMINPERWLRSDAGWFQYFIDSSVNSTAMAWLPSTMNKLACMEIKYKATSTLTRIVNNGWHEIKDIFSLWCSDFILLWNSNFAMLWFNDCYPSQKSAFGHHHINAYSHSGVRADQLGLLHHHLSSSHGWVWSCCCGKVVYFTSQPYTRLCLALRSFYLTSCPLHLCTFLCSLDAEFRGVPPRCDGLVDSCLCGAFLLRSRQWISFYFSTVTKA